MDNLRKGGFLIAKIHQLGGRVFARKLKEFGVSDLNPSQGRILYALWEKDNIPITELSIKTQLEKSTLTSMLKRLEKDGFIERKRESSDMRKVCIKRTKKDKSFQKAFLKVSEQMANVFYKGMNQKQIDQFEGYLEKVLKNLEKFDVDNQD